MLCEIGGTVGDIEGLPFFEAIRQIKNDLPRDHAIYIHLTLLPFIPSAGELKTKPTQHSVKELRSIGIQPDILLCRTDRPIPKEERRKLGLFCNVRESAVIEARDVDNIYAVPEAYHAAGLDDEVLAASESSREIPPALQSWHDINERVRNPEGDVTIAIVGKYTGMKDAYKSLIEALSHGGIANKVKVNLDWIESEVFENEDPAPFLEHVNGILVPGGFGQRGAEGKIRAAQFARERDVPYFGICFGMQMAVIEAARNLVGIEQANSTEFGPTPRTAGRPDDGMAARQRTGEALEGRRSRRHHAARRLSGGAQARQPGLGRLWRRDRDFRASPPSLRGQHRLQGPARAAWPALLGPLARWRVAGNRRIRGSSLVHRRAIPSRTEVAAVRAASAVRIVHSGRGGADAGWCSRSRRGGRMARTFLPLCPQNYSAAAYWESACAGTTSGECARPHGETVSTVIAATKPPTSRFAHASAAKEQSIAVRLSKKLDCFAAFLMTTSMGTRLRATHVRVLAARMRPRWREFSAFP